MKRRHAADSNPPELVPSKKARRATQDAVFPWCALPPEVQQIALATLDFVTRAAFAGVSTDERYWLRLTDEKTGHEYVRPCPLDYYEQLAALLTAPATTLAFKDHWLRAAPINRLQLWLSLRPHQLAHALLPRFKPSQITACWSACIARAAFEDDADKDMAAFCQQTAVRLLRLWPLSPEIYTDILHGRQLGMEIEGLAVAREWRSPAAFLFADAMRQRARHPLLFSASDGSELDEEEEEPSGGWLDMSESAAEQWGESADDD